MHRFIFVIKLVIWTLLALALREAHVFVLVEIYRANVVLVFFVIVKIYTAFAKSHSKISFHKLL